jgi:hypothetical protein
MSAPATVALKPIVFGDSWDGLTVSMTSDGTALDSDISAIRMFFKNDEGATGLELSNTSGITITDANAWEFTVDSIARFPLAIGQWYWSIEITAADNNRKTRLAGSIEVLDDATQ